MRMVWYNTATFSCYQIQCSQAATALAGHFQVGQNPLYILSTNIFEKFRITGKGKRVNGEGVELAWGLSVTLSC